jgi:hypothetical protein
MINYTQCISRLMRDIVTRVPRLSYVDMDSVLVFARHGRTGCAGAFATCHSMNLPTSEPGYYYWRDGATGRITRRSRSFVTKSPSVFVDGRKIGYLVSFGLPRYCDQSLVGSRKAKYYDNAAPWVAKLDTIVHELYHIDPLAVGIRRVERNDGGSAAGSHGKSFLEEVADMVGEYFRSRPDPAVYEFLRYGFAELEQRYGGVSGTTFRTFPSYPQRYIDVLPAAKQPPMPRAVRIQPISAPVGQRHFTEHDLVSRQFFSTVTSRSSRRESRPAPPVRYTALPQELNVAAAKDGSGPAAP